MTARSSPFHWLRRALPWAAGIGFALLLAPGDAAGPMLSTVDGSSTSYHWRLEANYGPTGEGWVTPDTVLPIVIYPGSVVDPRAWRRLPAPRLVGLDRLPDGLAWHIESWDLLAADDAWIGMDGRPRVVRLAETSWIPEGGTPGVVVTTYHYDSFDRPLPPPSLPRTVPDPSGGH